MSEDKDECNIQIRIPKIEIKDDKVVYDNEEMRTYLQKITTKNTCKDNMQALEDFNKLYQKIITLYEKLNYCKCDRRMNLLVTFSKICMWGVLLVKNYMENLKCPDEIKGIFGFSGQKVENFLNYASQYQRISFLTLFMFEVENLLGALHDEFFLPEDKKKGYDHICKQILTKINVKDYERIIHVLRCPAYIRNTMHANGMHTKEYKKLKIKGRLFEFKENEYIKETEWTDIYFLLDALIDVVGEILLHPKIKEINLIRHRYLNWCDGFLQEGFTDQLNR